MIPLTRTDGAEPSATVRHSMERADVIVALTKYTLTHGKSTKKALERGCRVLSIPSINERIFLSRALEGDPDMVRTAVRITELLSGGQIARVSTGEGTDITCGLGGWSRPGGADTGEIEHAGILANLPAGESLISPVEGSTNGRAVINASISGGIGILSEPVILDIENGRVVATHGGAQAERFHAILDSSDENAYNIAELAFGINPYAEVIGNIIIDEKTVNTSHFGIGNSRMLGGTVYSNVHVDAVFYGPRVEVDDHLIMENGTFFTGTAPWETLEYEGYREGVLGTVGLCGDYEFGTQEGIFKRWKDVMGRSFSTRVGDEAASRACAALVSSLKAGAVDAVSAAKRCALDEGTAFRAMAMLQRYELLALKG